MLLLPHWQPCAPRPAGPASSTAPHSPSAPADPDGLKRLKFLATRWHIAFNSMLVLGLFLSTLM